MYKGKKFTPFTHDELGLKNSLINYARGLKGKAGFENDLAAAFIYSSFTEYMAENLLENLRHFVYKGTYDQYTGIIFIDERGEKKKKTLGQILGELEKFDFPDKASILACIKAVSSARNKMFHNFAKATTSQLDQLLSEDVLTIQDQTEELLIKINVVYTGLTKILMSHENSNQDNIPTDIHNGQETEEKIDKI